MIAFTFVFVTMPMILVLPTRGRSSRCHPAPLSHAVVAGPMREPHGGPGLGPQEEAERSPPGAPRLGRIRHIRFQGTVTSVIFDFKVQRPPMYSILGAIKLPYQFIYFPNSLYFCLGLASCSVIVYIPVCATLARSPGFFSCVCLFDACV